MATPDKVNIADLGPLWADVSAGMQAMILTPGPASYDKLFRAFNTYAAAMFELGLYNGYQQGVESKHADT